MMKRLYVEYCRFIGLVLTVLMIFSASAMAQSFSEARPFSEGLAAVKLEGGWGYIDKSGAVAIAPEFERAEPFNDGLAAVMVGGRWGFIDKSGVVVVKPNYASVGPFREGRARVFSFETLVGFIDKSGKEIVPCEYWEASNFSEGLARVRKQSFDGYIDLSGKAALEVKPLPGEKIYNAYSFSEGLAAVEVGNEGQVGRVRVDYIDRQGKRVIKSRLFLSDYDSQREFVGYFSDGLALLMTKGYEAAYIDKSGKEVIKRRIGIGQPFSVGLAAWPMLCEDGLNMVKLFGFINRTGSFAIEPQFAAVRPFKQGLAAAQQPYSQGGKWGYINTEGKWIIPPQYTAAGSFQEDFALVQLESGEWEYLKGK